MGIYQDQIFEERAAILESDGGLTRQDAENYAWLLVYGNRQIQQDQYEERAAIMEYDGKLTRSEAESKAHALVFGE